MREAGVQEAGEIMRVINAAFNPAEGFFVDGDRVSLDDVLHYFERGVFLVTDDMTGCIYVELRGDRAYFGLLSVDPARQKGGIGRALIVAAEAYGREHGCTFMDLRIVNLRAELPAFYGKLGYREAGTEEFTPGAPTKLPCHFIKMQKSLA
ncbi:MAG: GCN5-related N-acetyltransferase [Candidatus Solibacter sp.]|nr:GCN5-related N-acetyltransferase [Candidatus Solibacter sp.]